MTTTEGMTAMIRSMLAAISLIAALFTGHSAPDPHPANPQGYNSCDWTNAPELCDPDDNPQDRVGEPITLIPNWVNCNRLHNDRAWYSCYRRINTLHRHWHRIGHIYGHHGVWKLNGRRPIFVARHWGIMITEDDPRWNCITMGNRQCGPNYRQIDDLPHWRFWYNTIIAEHDGYDPYRCLVKIADTTIIACQDGWVTTS